MTDKKKFIFSNLLSLVLGIVIGVGGFGIVSNINKNEKVPEQTATLPDYGGAVIGEAQENGIQMMKTAIPVEEYATYGVSEQAEKAYTITATVKPEEATNKKVNWSLSFTNADSAWAKDKNISDYLTLTPESNDALRATLVCLQAFGETAVVTVTAQEDSTVKATCNVEYVKRITDATFGWSAMEGVSTDSDFILATGAKLKTFRTTASAFNNAKKTLRVTIGESVGTVSDTYTYSAIMSWNPTYKSYSENIFATTFPNTPTELANGFTPTTEFLLNFFTSNVLISQYQQFYSYVSQKSDINYFVVKATIKGACSSWSKTYAIGLDQTTLALYA